MANWLYNLPIVWMSLVMFAACYFVATVIFLVVSRLAKGKLGPAFRAFSPGMLSPLGVIFGLLVAFIAAQVWGDSDRAKLAVDHEASSLRAVVLLAPCFPGEPEARLRSLVREHIDEVVSREWPSMAEQTASLRFTSPPLADAIKLVTGLDTKTPGQITAQREMLSGLENALDARRQRIILSRSSVNWVKWTCLVAQATFMLIAIALVHSENRITSAIALAIFATGFAVSLLLIAVHDHPFSGEVSIRPDLLLQVRPEETPLVPPASK